MASDGLPFKVWVLPELLVFFFFRYQDSSAYELVARKFLHTCQIPQRAGPLNHCAAAPKSGGRDAIAKPVVIALHVCASNSETPQFDPFAIPTFLQHSIVSEKLVLQSAQLSMFS